LAHPIQCINILLFVYKALERLYGPLRTSGPGLLLSPLLTNFFPPENTIGSCHIRYRRPDKWRLFKTICHSDHWPAYQSCIGTLRRCQGCYSTHLKQPPGEDSNFLEAFPTPTSTHFCKIAGRHIERGSKNSGRESFRHLDHTYASYRSLDR